VSPLHPSSAAKYLRADDHSPQLLASQKYEKTSGITVNYAGVKSYAIPLRELAGDPLCGLSSGLVQVSKSAADAVAVTRERCWKYDWCVEFDIRRAFDALDWDLTRKAIREHVKDPWALLYIERWLTAPAVSPDGQAVQRSKGVPQGSVIGPVLMNLYMHYAFDRWMQRQYPQCPFVRYAHDGRPSRTVL
jgi:hypothetical protein